MKHLLIAFALVLFTACSSDDPPKDYSAENDLEIQTYITDNNLTAEKSNSGLYYVIDNPGTGENPVSTDRIKIIYKGYFTDGTVFGESSAEGGSGILQNFIRGWVEGIPHFKEGGSGKLLIPAHLAYGSDDYGDIPGGSVLIFDIELIYVNYKTENEQQIQKYLTDNNLTAQESGTGLHFIMDDIGTGESPESTDNIKAAYKGYFTNGTVFEESSAEGVSFNLQNVIPGWTEGFTYFNEGGTGVLLIPSHLAYGNYDYGGIPGGSVMIFDIELISVN